MGSFILYGFGESGNSYKAALMLELCKLDWTCRKVDFFNGETRTPEFRSQINEMGEVPVLVHEKVSLAQSGIILDYLAEHTRKFGAKSDGERREIWRWILFDNHKFTSYLATLRYLLRFAKTGETPVTEFFRQRAVNALKVVDGHLAQQPFMVGKRATIADLSLCAYPFYGDELGVPLRDFPNVLNWLDRIRSLSGWKPAYELMPPMFET